MDHGDGALTAERERRTRGVGAEAAGERRGDGPDDALGARQGPLGASADGGNNRADELVQWGKTGGPYCRV
jgi:hypothetical protein